MWLGSRTLSSLGATPSVARLQGIADGIPGSIQTLGYMRQFVLDAVRDPAQGVRDLALRIIGNAGYVGQVRAVQCWTQSNIRYVRDPPIAELVQTPQKTLQWMAGDCDDQAVLVAALLTSIGHPCQFLAMWFTPEDGHVVTRTKIGTRWIAVDTIKPVPMGYLPPGIQQTYTKDI